MRRFSVFLIIVAVLILAVSSFNSGSAARDNERPIYSITLADEVISPVTAEYISNSIEKAEVDGARLLIIKLDTPGGLLTSTRKIVKKMLGSSVPLVVYVAPQGARAGSAGVFITLAANIAAMAPSTNIGAAHPVTMGEKRSLADTIEEIADKFSKDKDKKKTVKKPEKPRDPMEDKIMNDTIAWVTTIAETRGRNVGWAIKSVTESASISEDVALKNGVINFIAQDEADLLKKIDGTVVNLPAGSLRLQTGGVKPIEIPMSLRQIILSILASPNIAYILLMLGFYGLIFEFTHPGIGFPGVAGVIAIITGFYGVHMLEANYAGIALIILAIILFIMEVKVVSYGLLTLGGLVSLVVGSLMLFDSPNDFMRVSLPVIASFAITTFAIVMFLATIVVRSHRRRIATGNEGMMGMSGEVYEWSGKRGKIYIHGELWNAAGERAYERGDKVEVVRVEGMKLIVR